MGFGHPHSRKITQQWVSGQSPFKKNHSTVGIGPIPIQKASLNNGVRPIPVQEESPNSWGSGQTPFKKNDSTVGLGPIPLQESLSSGVRANSRSRRATKQRGSANPRSRRITQQWGSDQIPIQEEPANNGFRPSPFKKNLRPIAVQEESLNSGVRANPRNNGVRAAPPSGRMAQQDNSLGWYYRTF